jgi:hypothetical protein
MPQIPTQAPEAKTASAPRGANAPATGSAPSEEGTIPSEEGTIIAAYFQPVTSEAQTADFSQSIDIGESGKEQQSSSVSASKGERNSDLRERFRHFIQEDGPEKAAVETQGTKRLEIRCNSEFYDLIDRLANKEGLSRSDFLRRSVGLYTRALMEKESGRVLGVAALENNHIVLKELIQI